MKANNFYIYFILIVLIFIKFLGAVLSSSLILSSGVIHAMLDFGIVLFGSVSFYIGQKKREKIKFYEYTYLEVLFAIAYSVSLFLVIAYLIETSVYILIYGKSNNIFDVEGLENITSLAVNYKIALIFAVLNLIIQSGIAFSAHLLTKKYNKNVSLKAILWHVVVDLLSSVIALVGIAIGYSTNYKWVDPLFALIISVLILRNATSIIWKSSKALKRMLTHKTIYDISQAIEALHPNIVGVHYLEITDKFGSSNLSCHIVTNDVSKTQEIIDKTNLLLESKFKIFASNIQVETSCDSHTA